MKNDSIEMAKDSHAVWLGYPIPTDSEVKTESQRDWQKFLRLQHIAYNTLCGKERDQQPGIYNVLTR
jgi:hypothetical protein